jgi:hypothetical protein
MKRAVLHKVNVLMVNFFSKAETQYFNPMPDGKSQGSGAEFP